MPYFGGMMGRPMVAPGGLMQGWGRPGQMPQPNVAPQAPTGIMQMPMPQMYPGGFGTQPGPPNIAPSNPGVAQMPMPQMQPGGFGTMPPSPNQGLGLGVNGAPNIDPRKMQFFQNRMNLGFGQNRWV